MANRFLKALAAVKLVELDEEEEKKVAAEPPSMSMDEIDAILAADAEAEGKAPPPPPPKPKPAVAPPAQPITASSEIAEGRPFEDYYRSHTVPEAPYSAEKLLRVLDGLKAMPSATRKAAVIAMDAADDEWKIADAVLDAQRKARVLALVQKNVTHQVEQIIETAATEKATRDSYLAEATAQIQKKIQDLETMLQQETQQITKQKAEIDARVSAAREASAREVERLRLESDRLAELPTMFAAEVSDPS